MVVAWQVCTPIADKVMKYAHRGDHTIVKDATKTRGKLEKERFRSVVVTKKEKSRWKA